MVSGAVADDNINFTQYAGSINLFHVVTFRVMGRLSPLSDKDNPFRDICQLFLLYGVAIAVFGVKLTSIVTAIKFNDVPAIPTFNWYYRIIFPVKDIFHQVAFYQIFRFLISSHDVFSSVLRWTVPPPYVVNYTRQRSRRQAYFKIIFYNVKRPSINQGALIKSGRWLHCLTPFRLLAGD